MYKFCFSVLVALASCATAAAQTPFPVRYVDVGQTAVVPAGEYVLSRETVVRGGTLILEAGVKIKVQSVGRPLQMAGGVLEIRGTESNPVVIEPDAGHTCGQILCYFGNGSRPKLSVSHLDYSTTKASAGTCFVLSATDFSFFDSAIYSASAGSPRRGCIQAGNDSQGIVSNCILECLKEPNVVTSGLIIGNGTSQTDKVVANNIIAINCSNPININNRNVVGFSVTIE